MADVFLIIEASYLTVLSQKRCSLLQLVIVYQPYVIDRSRGAPALPSFNKRAKDRSIIGYQRGLRVVFFKGIFGLFCF